MHRNLVAATLALTALGLTACEQNRGLAANPKICADFKAAKGAPALAPADGAAPVDECARRWAYSLAASADDADTVAAAVATACNTQLTRWNQQTLAQPAGDGEATSIVTGEPTSPLAEHNAFTHNRARFYVVQARAGRCAPPPVTNGVPDGV